MLKDLHVKETIAEAKGKYIRENGRLGLASIRPLYGLYTASIRPLYGPYTAFIRPLYGLYTATIRPLYGHLKDILHAFIRPINGYKNIIYGLHTASIWPLYGLYTATIRPLYGLYTASIRPYRGRIEAIVADTGPVGWVNFWPGCSLVTKY